MPATILGERLHIIIYNVNDLITTGGKMFYKILYSTS